MAPACHNEDVMASKNNVIYPEFTNSPETELRQRVRTWTHRLVNGPKAVPDEGVALDELKRIADGIIEVQAESSQGISYKVTAALMAAALTLDSDHIITNFLESILDDLSALSA